MVGPGQTSVVLQSEVNPCDFQGCPASDLWLWSLHCTVPYVRI